MKGHLKNDKPSLRQFIRSIAARWFAVVLGVSAGLSAGLPVAAHSLSTPEWFYTVDVPVINQSSGERDRAGAIALLGVLSRVSGLASVPRNPAIAQALKDPTRFYSGFRYVDGRTPAEGPQLQVDFQREAILRLAKEAELPVWWTRRPKVIVWLVLEEAGERRILHRSSRHPLVAEITDYSRRVGIDVVLPEMDDEDLINISAQEVWGNVAGALGRASQRYNPDIQLVGRIRGELSLTGRSLVGNWRFAWAGNNRSLNFDTPQFAAAVDAGLGVLVETLKNEFSVVARQDHLWTLSISGMREVSDYMAVMRYLEQLDFIDAVSLKAVQGDVISLAVATRADGGQLLNLLKAEALLVEDSLYDGTGVQLLWRGGS